jgi:hypothetical protein
MKCQKKLLSNKKLGYLSRYSDEFRAGRPGFDSLQKQEFFASPQRPGRLWAPLGLLSNEYSGLFPGSKAAGA